MLTQSPLSLLYNVGNRQNDEQRKEEKSKFVKQFNIWKNRRKKRKLIIKKVKNILIAKKAVGFDPNLDYYICVTNNYNNYNKNKIYSSKSIGIFLIEYPKEWRKVNL